MYKEESNNVSRIAVSIAFYTWPPMCKYLLPGESAQRIQIVDSFWFIFATFRIVFHLVRSLFAAAAALCIHFFLFSFVSLCLHLEKRSEPTQPASCVTLKHWHCCRCVSPLYYVLIYLNCSRFGCMQRAPVQAHTDASARLFREAAQLTVI